MSCNPKCQKTASHNGYHRIMVSQPGNEKFSAYTPHPQCSSCEKEDYQEALEQIKVSELFGYDQTKIDRYWRVMGKNKRR